MKYISSTCLGAKLWTFSQFIYIYMYTYKKERERGSAVLHRPLLLLEQEVLAPFTLINCVSVEITHTGLEDRPLMTL